MNCDDGNSCTTDSCVDASCINDPCDNCCDGQCCAEGETCCGNDDDDRSCCSSDSICCLSGACCGPGTSCCGEGCCATENDCCGNGTCCDHACDGCVINGRLETVDPSASITVSANPVCVEDTIVFTAPAVVDTGGLKWENCNDVPLSGGVTYHWTLTLPPDYPAPLPPTGGQGISVSVVAKAAGTYSVTFTAEPTRTECPPDSLGLGSASASTDIVQITAERIDQDQPANSNWQSLGAGSPVFGGSEASTADNLRLTVDPGSDPVSAITWSVEGSGSATYPPPPTGPTATVWNVGDLLNPVPGDITFKVRVAYTDGSSRCGEFESEMGVRTDDVIVVGWIDSQAIPLSTVGVDPTFILPTLTPSGSASVPLCTQYVGLLTQGDVQPNGISLVGAANPNRLYLVHWLFKFAGNLDPTTTIPGDFRDPTDQFLEEGTFQAFVASLINYKLINRYQVRYLASGGTFSTSPVQLQRLAAIGWTPEPCGSGIALVGQGGASNGYLGAFPSSVWHINDGSPDSSGVLAFNTLMGNAVPTNPLFWENIGSRIQFRADGDTQGEIDVQIFPTYYVYRNGQLSETIPQAATPTSVFTLFPYPFGAIPCDGSSPHGSINFPHQQGRCGYAGPPIEVTAGDTPYWP